MLKKLDSIFRANRIFLFLVFYRWVSLLPALLAWNKAPLHYLLPPLWVIAITLIVNSFVTLFNRQLNQLVLQRPMLLGVDILFSAFILTISGGMNGPYYLYALNPLLAGAFFFQLRGALFVSAFFTPLYLLAGYFSSTIANTNVLAIELAGIWLFPILYAYPSMLLRDVSRAREELADARDELAKKHENLTIAHRQLEIIHDLTVLLQAAPDLISVEERVLGAVTADLGFSKAVVATVDPAFEELGGWLVYPPDATFPKTEPSALKSESGEMVRALLERNNFVTNGQVVIQDRALNNWLMQNKWFVIPMFLREHPVGLLLVEESGLTTERKSTLMTVANQAALALGTTTLCIDRARRLAVETERNRIARDIHDTVAQSLFGIVYSLDACITMLPEKAADVKKELTELRSLANSAHEEVRRSIFDLWPSALTLDVFMTDLSNYVSSCSRPRPFSIIFNNSGDFNSLSSGVRRTVYRLAQEALANSAQHSGADSARLCLNINQEQVYMSISDEGCGFDPSVVLSRNVNGGHFGLQGILERTRALGGTCEIVSQPDAGARIMIALPIHGQPHHA